MTTFAIDAHDTITAYATGEAIPAGQDQFGSEKELAQLVSQWPMSIAPGFPGGRFAEIWNSFAGVPPFGDLKPVKKFTDRKTAVARIWKAVQALTPTAAPQAAPAPKKAKAAEAAKDTTATDGAKPAREGSKTAIVLDMLRRPEGATLADIMTSTGWQAHSVRGFISGALTKKMGLAVKSFKSESGDRAYRIA